MSSFIRLSSGGSLSGTLQSATKAEGMYQGKPSGSKRVHLAGVWDGQGQGTIDAPLGLMNELVPIGVVSDAGNNMLSVDSSKRLTISKSGQGTATQWHAALVGGSAPAQQSRNGQQDAPVSAVPPAQRQGAEHPGITFDRLGATLGACIRRAKSEWEAAFPSQAAGDLAGFCAEIAASAHTLFIAADKRGLLSSASAEAKAKFSPKAEAPKPVTKEQIDVIDDLCASIGCQAVKAITSIGLTKQMESLTYEEANKVIVWLKNEEAKAVTDPPPPGRREEDIPF